MLPLKFQGTWMVPSSYPFLPKQTSEKNSDRIPMFCTSSWNLFEHLCQSTQRRISCNTIFLQSIRTFWSSIWSSRVEVPFILIDLCRFSILYRCAPLGAWKCSQARPAALQCCGSPLSAVSSTCKEITRDKCRQMPWKCAPCPVHCKPD